MGEEEEGSALLCGEISRLEVIRPDVYEPSAWECASGWVREAVGPGEDNCSSFPLCSHERGEKKAADIREPRSLLFRNPPPPFFFLSPSLPLPPSTLHPSFHYHHRHLHITSEM